MFYTPHISPGDKTYFVASATELLQTTSRNLILATGGVFLVWVFMASLLWPEELGWNILLMLPVVVFFLALQNRFIEGLTSGRG